MPTHLVSPERRTLHGYFSRDLTPVVTIDPGDRVIFRTLDASWGLIEQAPGFEQAAQFSPRDPEDDKGHALCGPVAIRGAKAGMTLEVKLKRIRPAAWGRSGAGGFPSPLNQRLGLADGVYQPTYWDLEVAAGIARSRTGHQLRLRPFLGILGMPPAEPGKHSTGPPRFCGGNIDCKELVVGSSLYLPIAVDGGLFSTGDGHGVQGDGEVAGPALECPMEEVEIEFELHPELHLTQPRAVTPAGRITFGFHQELTEAAFLALEDMLDWMGELQGFDRKEALMLASLAVDLHVTQVVNGVRGVHAILPPDVLAHG